MIMSDRDIAHRCLHVGEVHATGGPMIEPFLPGPISIAEVDGKPAKVISYGLSSYGYDIRVADKFKIFHNVHGSIVDPKKLDPLNFLDIERSDRPISIPPNSFALCHSFEYIRVPRDVMVICLGKSTYARCGIVVNVTPLEPQWEGNITIEISNTTPNPALVYPMEGICQLIFLRHPEGCGLSYRDKSGKYQGQTGVTLPRV